MNTEVKSADAPVDVEDSRLSLGKTIISQTDFASKVLKLDMVASFSK